MLLLMKELVTNILSLLDIDGNDANTLVRYCHWGFATAATATKACSSKKVSLLWYIFTPSQCVAFDFDCITAFI